MSNRPDYARERRHRSTGGGSSPRETVESPKSRFRSWVLGSRAARHSRRCSTRRRCTTTAGGHEGDELPVPIGARPAPGARRSSRRCSPSRRARRARVARSRCCRRRSTWRATRAGAGAEETYGEDPHLVSEIGLCRRPQLRGTRCRQLDAGHAFATAKHYAAARAERRRHQHGADAGRPSASCARKLPALRARDHGRHRSLRDAVVQRNRRRPSHRQRVSPRLGPAPGVGLPGRDRLRLQRDSSSSPSVITSPDRWRKPARLAISVGVDLEMPDRRVDPTLADQAQAGQLDERLVDAAAGHMLRLEVPGRTVPVSGHGCGRR